jgi:HEAT repeat protein
MKVVVPVMAALLALPQVRDRATTPPTAAAAESDAAAVARGWAAVAAGQFDNGARAADGVLRRRPWDRAALTLKISAMSAAAPLSGLDVYEQWVNAKHKDDAALLEPVAIATLQEIAKGPDATHRIPSLTALVAAHVAGAKEALDSALAARPQSQEGYAADAEAARQGDQGALGRLVVASGNPASATVELVRALEQIGAAGESGLLMLVTVPNPQVRAEVILALGRMKSERALPVLQAAFGGMDPATRVPATIALAQLGDTGALARVDQMLASNVPQLQIEAAEAWGGRPGPWVDVIRPLLDNTEGFTRLDAARAIAPVDPDAAKRTLSAAMADLNPVIRFESAKTMDALAATRPETADLPVLRQRLRDPDRGVRTAVASALLKLARLF